MQPSLADCIAALYGDGFRQFRVVPVFLGFGGHLRNDLPKLVAEIKRTHNDIEIVLDPPVGEHPEVIAAIARAVAS